jgi:flagellar motor switch protein FliN/FliY
MCPGEEAKVDETAQNVAVEETSQPGGGDGPEDGASEKPVAEDAAEVAGGDVKKAEFQDVASGPEKGAKPGMDLLMNVALPVSVELGRATMTIQEVLGIYEGSVIELERLAGEPVDILVSGKLLGKGEVVVVDDKFGVRITELINRMEGIGQ